MDEIDRVRARDAVARLRDEPKRGPRCERAVRGEECAEVGAMEKSASKDDEPAGEVVGDVARRHEVEVADRRQSGRGVQVA